MRMGAGTSTIVALWETPGGKNRFHDFAEARARDVTVPEGNLASIIGNHIRPDSVVRVSL